MSTEVDIRRAAGRSLIGRLVYGMRQGLVWTVTAVLTAAFALGYATAYLPPSSFWWTSPFAVGLPYVSALLLPLSVVGVLRAVRTRAVLRLAVTLAVLVMITARFGPGLWATLQAPAPPDAEAAGDLRVTSFNAPTHGPSRAELAQEFVQVVEAAGPDVLALQEAAAYRYDERGAIFERYSAPHLYRLVQTSAYDLPSWFPSRLRIQQPVVGHVDLDSLTLVGASDPVDRARIAPATRVVFTWDGQRVVLYNIHLYTVSKRKPWRESTFEWTAPSTWGPYLTAYRDATLRRVDEARTIRSAIEQETGPVIVAGDFNSTMHHWSYRHIARGLRNVMTESGSVWPATYPARFPVVGIDHILVGPEWQVVSASIGESHSYTDHRPVHARLRLGEF